MKATKKRVIALILAVALAFSMVLVMLVSSLTASAAGTNATTTTFTGSCSVMFDTSTRSLVGTYSGSSQISAANFEWFSGTTQVGTGYSYMPTAGGTYTLKIFATAGNAKSAYIESPGITLYKVSTDDFVSLSAPLGVYLAGERVSAYANVKDGASVTNWRASYSGIALPSSGNRVYFNMPKADITLSCDVSNMYRIKINGGKASKYTAMEGESITISASEVSGKEFSMWVCTGVSVLDATKTTTSFTMPKSDVVIQAAYKGEGASSSSADSSSDGSGSGTSSTSSSSSNTGNTGQNSGTNANTDINANTVKFSDPTRVKYSVLRSNNYDVKLYHATLGPNYDRIFKMARGTDYLVTNYFMLVINGNQEIKETPGPVTISLTIPEDLQKDGRNWRMICISRNNWAYSFPDTDSDVSTITFSPDRFCAFAMAFNDTPVIVEPTVTIAEAEAARQSAYRQGISQGIEQGKNTGYDSGYDSGYNAGYTEGMKNAQTVNPTPAPADGTQTGNVSDIKSASNSETSQTGSDTSGTEQKTPEPPANGMVDKVEAQYGTSTAGTLAPLEL